MFYVLCSILSAWPVIGSLGSSLLRLFPVEEWERKEKIIVYAFLSLPSTLFLQVVRVLSYFASLLLCPLIQSASRSNPITHNWEGDKESPPLGLSSLTFCLTRPWTPWPMASAVWCCIPGGSRTYYWKQLASLAEEVEEDAERERKRKKTRKKIEKQNSSTSSRVNLSDLRRFWEVDRSPLHSLVSWHGQGYFAFLLCFLLQPGPCYYFLFIFLPAFLSLFEWSAGDNCTSLEFQSKSSSTREERMLDTTLNSSHGCNSKAQTHSRHAAHSSFSFRVFSPPTSKLSWVPFAISSLFSLPSLATSQLVNLLKSILSLILAWSPRLTSILQCISFQILSLPSLFATWTQWNCPMFNCPLVQPLGPLARWVLSQHCQAQFNPFCPCFDVTFRLSCPFVPFAPSRVCGRRDNWRRDRQKGGWRRSV